MISMQRDNPGLLGIMVKAMMQIFKPTTPFVSFKVMDMLFHGVGIDCDRTELEASIVCPELKEISVMDVVNETYYMFSLFGKVSCFLMNKKFFFTFLYHREMRPQLENTRFYGELKITERMRKC
jgi:hypothetical protein